ncbi:MAG TPA: DDE-type integrase/transposase/recombinase [Nitrososphaerales archaeon]
MKKLWRRYRVEQKIPDLRKPGRKPGPGISGEEKIIILRAREEYKVCAFILERVIDVKYSLHIPHNRIHEVLKSMGLARSEPRKWIKYERKYSNSLWHVDWKILDGYGWLTAYEDDASRKVVGYAVFTNATSEHAVEVLEKAVKKWGKPASILSDRGSQFYAVESEVRMKGVTAFEIALAKHEIRQVLGRVHHPQTNGKVERFFRTVEEKIHEFKNIDELVTWYNSKRPHMSLNLDAIETPDEAFIRKMPQQGVIVDEESGEIYHAKTS